MRSENVYTSGKDQYPMYNAQTVRFIPLVETWDIYKLDIDTYITYIYIDAYAYVQLHIYVHIHVNVSPSILYRILP